MFTNNQSKAKQIKNKGLGSASTLKKIRSQDSIRIQDDRKSKYQTQTNSKSKALAPKQQFQIGSKSKQKNLHTKNIQQQYYREEKRYQRPKKINDIQQAIKTQTSKSIADAQNEKRKKEIYNRKQGIDPQIFKSTRINFPDSRTVITFDGKVIKVPPTHIETKTKHNYTSLSNSQYAITERQFTHYKAKHKKNKLKSKQKSKSKHMRKDSSKSVSKHKVKENRHCKSQQYIGSQRVLWGGLYEFKKAMVEQTQISPPKKQQKQYERPQIFDFQQIYELIQEDLQNCNQIKISEGIGKFRRECIKMMSEICGVIPLRRQTFYLAISIFDRAISKKINTSNFNLLALVSLTLSMKLQQAQLSIQFVYVLGIISSGKQSHLSSVHSHRQSSKQKSISRSNKKAKSKIKTRKIRIRQKNVRRISTSGIAKILRAYNCSKIQKIQFMQLQEKVTIYLRFKLWRIQAIYWADLLTCMWDQHILNSEEQSSSELLFRCPGYLANLSYLYQLLELAYMNEIVYKYPSIYIVLATMYLLTRITKENQNGYQFYRKSLCTSTNILFVDKTGINQIFWSFIQKLRIEMIQIISCCQFMSKFLQPTLMKASINHEESKDSVDLGLYLHQHNSDLYLNIIQ